MCFVVWVWYGICVLRRRCGCGMGVLQCRCGDLPVRYTVPADDTGLREAGSRRLWLRGMVEQRLMLPLFPPPGSPPSAIVGAGIT